MDKKRSVLIVDDALFMRKMLNRIIAGAGNYEIYEAGHGREAVDLYTKHMQDVVFLDISMPEMNGIEVLKELKRINKDAYIVMCSAIGQESMIMEAMENGAAEFIVKPFLPQHIIKALGEAEK